MNVPAAPSETPTPPPPSAPDAMARQWAMFAHLSALLGALLSGFWFGIGCFLGPLVIWLLKKDSMPFVDDQGKEALNFNLTLAIAGMVMLLFAIGTLGIGLLIVVPLGLLLGLLWLIFTIIAAIKASEGVAYRYPLSLRLIR